MKNIISVAILFLAILPLPLFSQNNDEPVALGLPGDNLNLYAVLEIFQKSPTLEEFEKSINDKEAKINNLDLNDDKKVDYISVINLKEESDHTIILRAILNEKESQDVAVIKVNKDKDGKVVIQIVGDDSLYGKNYIVEPTNKLATGTRNPGYIEKDDDIYYVNDWPLVIHIFSPAFVVYNSPWYWGFYPSYWQPWTPIYYQYYWGFHSHHFNNNFYRRWYNIRYPNYYRNYTRSRRTSTIVVQNIRRGTYNSTYDGRVYARPLAPVASRRTSSARSREVAPATRSNTKRPTSGDNGRRKSTSSTNRKTSDRRN